MRKRASVILSCLVGLLVVASPAFAYIDPGTGATFVGSMAPLIIGIVSGAFAFIMKVFWHPIKGFFTRLRGSQSEQS